MKRHQQDSDDSPRSGVAGDARACVGGETDGQQGEVASVGAASVEAEGETGRAPMSEPVPVCAAAPLPNTDSSTLPAQGVGAPLGKIPCAVSDTPPVADAIDTRDFGDDPWATAILNLRLIGYSYQQCGDKLGISQTAVRMCAHRHGIQAIVAATIAERTADHATAFLHAKLKATQRVAEHMDDMDPSVSLRAVEAALKAEPPEAMGDMRRAEVRPLINRADALARAEAAKRIIQGDGGER